MTKHKDEVRTPKLSHATTRQAYESGMDIGFKTAQLNPPDQIKWWFDEREAAVIDELATKLGLDRQGVLRQALRTYQLVAEGHSDLVERNPQPLKAAPVSGEAEELARDIVWNLMHQTDKHKVDRVAALLRSRMERAELFGRALIVLKGLNLAVDWELAPPIKKEIAAICAEFEALPSAPDTEEKP